MRGEECLSPGGAAEERDRRVREGVKAEQQRGDDIASRDDDEHEGEEEADRQAAGIAEKHFRRVLVEDGEADHRAEKRERQQPDIGGCRAKPSDGGDAERHWNDLRRRDPVDAVEEIDGVDEPHGSNHHQRTLDRQRHQLRK